MTCRQLTKAPDIIHGHHHVETWQALMRFQNTPAIFVVHDAIAWHDVPPMAPQIVFYAAVDLNCQERLTDRYLIPKDRVRLIYNSFDPERFPARNTLPEKPRRALVFSSYATRCSFLESIEQACAELNLPLDVIGSGMGKVHANPGEILQDYDLVFGIARCAIEAMATGAAVVLCGMAGLGPLVTPENVGGLQPWNFGKRILLAPHDKDLIIAEIKKYKPAGALAVCRHIRGNAALPVMIAQYQSLYREAMMHPVTPHGGLFAGALASAAQQAARFEHASMAVIAGKYSTLLPEGISNSLVLKIVECPRAATSDFIALVELENIDGEPLSSHPPYPVYLSYHWNSTRGKTAVFEGFRTPLPGIIGPNQKKLCRVKIEVPPETGNYRLRITLVQEGVMWFDLINPPLFAEVDVEVRKAN